MEYKSLVISLLALAFSASAYPDAFKCKTPDGKTVISSVPCQAGSRTEAVQPNDEVSPEQRRRAEQEVERQQKLLAEREAARAAEQQREQESRRKLAEEESLRQTQCLQNAQREPDAQLRANLIAACSGTAPPQPVIVQQPVYVPVAAFPPKRVPGSVTVHIGPRPQPPEEPPAHVKKPCRQESGMKRCD